MQPSEFIEKWQTVELTERAASQTHFNDLCSLLGIEDPVSADPNGEWFTFEKGASKVSGGDGWADVWRKGCFAWEYKGKKKNLDEAFKQLLQYTIALENPPLLIVSDMDRFRIHTNWTNTVQDVHEFNLEDLRDAAIRDFLHDCFKDPEKLKPAITRQMLTEEAAQKFAALAQRLRARGIDPETIAHFVNRLVFCMFAEDVGLLPNKMFLRMLEHCQQAPEDFADHARTLFSAMQSGGTVGFERVEWFNGGLFDSETSLPLEKADVRDLLDTARLDWSEIDPSILGTLFERGLDPDKRSQLGAHYTDQDKIMMIVNPVIVDPLLAEWGNVKKQIVTVLGKARVARSKSARTRAEKRAERFHTAFLERLRDFRVLDPACGSGNFLYLSLLALKRIEHRVNLEAEELGLSRSFPTVGPECVKGIELNSYAAELARVSVWVGEIQWMRRNGFDAARNPILRPLETIECRDAVLDPDGRVADWPEADVVVGNPPFLGDKKMIRELGEDYVARLRAAHSEHVPGGANLVCYWLYHSKMAIDSGRTKRVGLVTTNAIRTGADRKVLQLLCESADLFDAWADEPWIVDGASVRVSLICVSTEQWKKRLNGTQVNKITSSLSQFPKPLPAVVEENIKTSFTGTILNGPFEVDTQVAHEWLTAPTNVAGHKNQDVLRLTANGEDLLQRGDRKWLLDFGTSMSEQEAALFEAPYEYALRNIKSYRQRKNKNGEFVVRRQSHRDKWWIHAESRPGMRRALKGLGRFIVTPMVSGTRVFCFMDSAYMPNQKLVVFPRDDDVFFGILSSLIHEIWTLEYCSWIGAGNDPTYAAKSVYLKFPFPEGLTPNIPAADYAKDPRAVEIAAAAAQLNYMRENWLNPPDLVDRVPEIIDCYPDLLVPKHEEAAKKLKKRTLTNLYSERPVWLDQAHKALDEAVAKAYGWGDDWSAGRLTDDEILNRLFKLNQEVASA